MWKRTLFWGGVFCLFAMLLGNTAIAQDKAGSMRYNAISRQMEFYDGTYWYNFGLGVALGLCNQPGAMDYEPLLLISYQYCNGANWVKIVGIPTLSVCTRAGVIDYRGSTFMVCNGLLWTNIRGGRATNT